MNKKKPTKEVAELQQQVAELSEALARERADATNIRRRADEERAKLASFYKVMVVQQFLPALDNLERSLQHISTVSKEAPWKQGEAIIKGLEGVAKQFDKALTDSGVERIKTVGETFDPALHEAISLEDTGGDKEIVSEELQAGYKIGSDVIRHAMVKVKMVKKNA